MAAYALTDHDQIQRWAEERGARPACVKRTGGEGDVGIIRLDFSGYSGENSLDTIDWQAWFDKFERQNLALLVDESAESNFNKLVRRADDAPGPAVVAAAPRAGASDADADADEDADDQSSDDDVDEDAADEEDEDADLEDDDLDEDDEDDDFDEDDEDEEDAADDDEEDNSTEK